MGHAPYFITLFMGNRVGSGWVQVDVTDGLSAGNGELSIANC